MPGEGKVNSMKDILRATASFLAVGVLSVGLAAQTASARYDSDIQSRVTQQLSKKQEFRNLQATTEDGIVTLTGTVDLYQQKLDAAKKVRKLDSVQGVRNLVAVSSSAPDAEVEAKLDRKLHYDRIGYDNQFNFVDVSVKDGVATLQGETYNDVGRDSALALANTMPGVKDVVDDIKVSPVSGFDDRIRYQRDACDLSRLGAGALCQRSGAAHPNRGGQRQAEPVRHSRLGDGQADRWHAGQPGLRRVQRAEQPGSSEGFVT